MRTETEIRTVELGVAIASTYMAAVTMIKSSLYIKLKNWILGFLAPLLLSFGADPTFFDIIILGGITALSFFAWRRGDQAGFGRLFSMNMLMFFPSVIDESTFNWINLVFPYEPAQILKPNWVFGVGLLLQGTYLTLRYTVRFRKVREELMDREAEATDIDLVSRGQMTYLAQLVLVTVIISAGIYNAVPFVKEYVSVEASGLPLPHIIIGVACTFLIAATIILYLRSEGRKTNTTNETSVEVL